MILTIEELRLLNNLSIESAMENIYFHKTREYFQEVYQSYINGSYRSAVVMLYSVVICDLVYKLQELRDRYTDETAESILKKIKESQEQNSSLSQWEKELVEEISKRTNLLEIHDRKNIEFLMNHRHLSAHPVLVQSDLLFKPNKETVRAHMRNMLEGILIKPPILSNKIFNTLLEDLEEVKDEFPKNETLRRYLDSKYFNYFNDTIEDLVIKKIWKFVFTKNDTRCINNRLINTRVLLIMLDKNKNKFEQLIEKDRGYFSSTILIDDMDVLKSLVVLLSQSEKIFTYLDQHLKERIAPKINADFQLFTIAIFLSDNFKEHIKNIDTKLNLDFHSQTIAEAGFLYKCSIKYDCIDDIFELFIKNFSKSPSYDEADTRYQLLIEPYLDKFDKKQFVKMIEGINGNRQISDRRNSGESNRKIKEHADRKLGENFSYSDYKQFKI